jgi:MFS family permease
MAANSAGGGEAAPSARTARLLLTLIFFCNVLDFLLLTMVIPLFPLHLPDERPVLLGLLFASKSIVQLLIAPVSAWLVHRVGARTPHVAGLAVLLGATALYTAVRSAGYPGMMASRCLQGLGSSLTGTAGMSALCLAYPDGKGRSEAIGTALGGVGVGVLIGPVIGSWLVRYGADIPYIVVAVFAAVVFAAALIIHYGVRELRMLLSSENAAGTAGGAGSATAAAAAAATAAAQGDVLQEGSSNQSMIGSINDGGGGGALLDATDHEHGTVELISKPSSTTPLPSAAAAAADGASTATAEPESFLSTLTVLRDGEILWGFIVLFAMNALVAILDPIIPLMAAEPPLSVAKEDTGFVFVSATVTYTAATPVIGWIGERTGRFYLLTAIGIVIISVSTATLALPHTVPGLITLLGAMGIGIALVDAPMPAIMSICSEERHGSNFGTIMALVDVAFSFGFAIGPIAGTYVAENFGYQATFISFSAACLCTLVPLGVMGRRRYRREVSLRAIEGSGQRLLDMENGS